MIRLNRMSGGELREALGALEITPFEMSQLTHVPERRVLRWLHGEETVPLCAALTVPEAKALAFATRS